MRVLLLEDDARLAEAYVRCLRDEGMAVDAVSTLAETRRAAAFNDYDCLVLDRFVPDGDAVDLMAELDGQGALAPVVVVSSAGQGDQRLEGLAAGADDYLSKPVRLAELALRVRRVAIRHSAGGVHGPIRVGRVCLDRGHRRVSVDGDDVHLTLTQYAVLEHLVVHRERMVPIDELLEHCWDDRRDLFSNPLRSQITRLRKIFRGVLRFPAVGSTGYRLDVEDTT